MTWPGNYAAQALTVQALEKRIEDLRKVRSKVVVYSWTEPTQQEFEAAYVAQTSFTLPIQAGTTLLWADMRNPGNYVPYQVINDQASGSFSSGTVYPYVNEQTYSPFRFLGMAHGWSLLGEGNHVKFRTSQGRFLLNPNTWVERGLTMMWMYFSISLQGATQDLPIYGNESEVTGIGPNGLWLNHELELSVDLFDIIRMHAQFSTETAANEQQNSLAQTKLILSNRAPGSAQALSGEDSYMTGLIYVWDPVDLLDDAGNKNHQGWGAAGVGYAGSISATTAGNQHVNFYAFEKNDNLAPLPQFGLGEGIYNDAAIATPDSKIWWYGVFNQDTPAILTEIG